MNLTEQIKRHWLLIIVAALVISILLLLWNTATNTTTAIKKLVLGAMAYGLVFCAALAGNFGIAVAFMAAGLSLLNHLFGWFSSLASQLSVGTTTNLSSANVDWVQHVVDTVAATDNPATTNNQLSTATGTDSVLPNILGNTQN